MEVWWESGNCPVNPTRYPITLDKSNLIKLVAVQNDVTAIWPDVMTLMDDV